jgi:hypothetical protein
MKRTNEQLSDYPPLGMEVRLIQRFVSLKGRRILELGCGDGRLTREVAPLASTVVAVEPALMLLVVQLSQDLCRNDHGVFTAARAHLKIEGQPGMQPEVGVGDKRFPVT